MEASCSRLSSLLATLLFRRKAEEGRAEAVLILGGGKARELRCAKMLRESQLGEVAGRLILSSGAASRDDIAAAAGVDRSMVGIDTTAVDTLSNFTTLAPTLSKIGIERIIVATSQTHMLRAMPIAVIVLGAHGITARPWVCPDADGA